MRSKRLTRLVLLFTVIAVTVTVALLIRKTKCPYGDNCLNLPSREFDLNSLEITGWIAWWKEDEAYNLLKQRSERIKRVSPVWFYVNENYELEEKVPPGSTNDETATKLRELDIELVPTLASELSGEELSTFVDTDNPQTQELILDLHSRLLQLDASGLDIDLEQIKEADKNNFTDFIYLVKDELRKSNLSVSVTVHAQTALRSYEITKGQDLRKISEIADEVRIMAYDYHGPFSEPGAIAPLDWLKQVTVYNLTLIPKEKIFMGIPSYGYIWEMDGDAKGYQYDDFIAYVKRYEEENSDNVKVSRDPDSGELVYESEHFVGWLSDSEAILQKMKVVNYYGVERFVIWNLGGMDPQLFEDPTP